MATLMSRGLVVLFLCLSSLGAVAQQPPQNPLTQPGKIDLNTRITDGDDTWNLMYWTPFAKFGVRDVMPEHGRDTWAYGGFFRPLLPSGSKSDLILGGNVLRLNGRTDYELQGEWRMPNGFGIGGGVVRRDTSPVDVSFLKVTWRGKVTPRWNTILEAQSQRMFNHTSPGGYAAIYDPVSMFVYGNDGEQWRGTIGLIAPDHKTAFRPAAEALYIDNDIGRVAGPKTLSVVATGRFTGGFLSHPARLGRAMGPQGLEFGNPVSFMDPWNRRLDPWEFGSMFDFGLLRNDLPNGTRTERAEGLVFPFEMAGSTSPWLKPLFAGALRTRNGSARANGWMAGFVKPLGHFQIAAQLEDDSATKPRVTVGIIRWF